MFIIQTLNVAVCLTHPAVGKFATYFAIIVDCFIFGILFSTLVYSEL